MLRCSTLALFAILSATSFAADVGVRIRFGLNDTGNTVWDGKASVTPGAIERIDGWRFQDGDRVIGQAGWQASTRPLTVRRGNAAKKAKKKAPDSLADNGVFLFLTGVTDASVIKVETKQGNFQFRLSDIPYGKVIEQLKGGIDIERVAATRPMTSQRDDDDFPALAVAADGSAALAWVAFTPGIDREERSRAMEKAPTDFSFLAKPPGGDRLWLRLQRNGAWSEPIAVTAGGGDLYKCAVAIDGRGQTWVFWSENTSYPKTALANFEIFAASVTDGKVSAPIKISDMAGTDISPVATTDSSGRVWIAWQAARGQAFTIVERHQTAHGSWTAERKVSTQSANCWAPAIAAAADGRVAIAWDTYEKGDYDVWVREFPATGAPAAARPVANTADYEARAALTYDRQARLWIAWERSGATWGKDWGALDRDAGIGLYRDRQIGLRILAGNTWMEPAAPVASGLPGSRARRGPRALPVLRPEADSNRKAGEEAEAAGATTYNNIARLACDRDGRIWLFARSREGTFHTPLGMVWVDYAASYADDRWTGPTILPHSDNLLYNSPAVAAHPGGGFLVAHSSDHRQDRHVMRGAAAGNAAPPEGDPFDNDIFVSRLEMPSSPVTLKLVAARSLPAADPAATAATREERAAVERSRAQRIPYDGKQLRLVRGEFHRHTEISGDGGNDGPLEDMWRYGIDVAAMDWMGNGDHDNGNGREYTWWLTQKTTDAFRLPGRFDPPFTYERSVPYPEGHRNVVFAQRGVRTLPRLPKTAPEPIINAPDTLMLFDYLRHFQGVCASHTSATDMGTDWRDNASDVEPMVEIYQGARQNYERPGAPRSPTSDDAIGGWRPLGFINLALKKGYQFSFQSSSDHGSTHISYAMVYAEDTSREALLRAMRARHTYAATDNIVADFRCTAGGRDYMLGDAFNTNQAPTLRLKLVGTAPFAKVTLVKDDVEIHAITPNKANVELTWTDPTPTAGKTSYYYFRGEQADGELVWVSPMWITYQPGR